LAIYADALDDIERTRISQENRVRALRQVKGMSDSPEAVRLDALIDQLKALEHGRVLELQRAMRSHPLGPWQKAQCGIGAKQLARLLACIGDPYWHRLYDRPRQVSELWAFCGLHVFRLDHVASEAHKNCAGTDLLGSANHDRLDSHFSYVGVANLLGGDLGQNRCEIQVSDAGVAARSVKGRKSNWSVEAKQRAYLVAESCVKHVGSPYRPVYDERRIVTAERTHVAPCPRCGPSGHPAAVGSPWSKGHQHADALRIVSKTILRDLWIESRRLHEMEQV
jgi:hypothetical protein